MSKEDIYYLVMTYNRTGNCCHLDGNELIVLEPQDQWHFKQRIFNAKASVTKTIANLGRKLAKLDE